MRLNNQELQAAIGYAYNHASVAHYNALLAEQLKRATERKESGSAEGLLPAAGGSPATNCVALDPIKGIERLGDGDTEPTIDWLDGEEFNIAIHNVYMSPTSSSAGTKVDALKQLIRSHMPKVETDAEPVAIIHADGYWTPGKGMSEQEKYRANFAGWHKEVFAHPPRKFDEAKFQDWWICADPLVWKKRPGIGKGLPTAQDYARAAAKWAMGEE